MMDVKVGDTPFGELMQQAVKLKTHQAKPDRCRYDRRPKFVQNSMFSREDIVTARLLPFPERLQAALDYKARGNAFFQSNALLDAGLQYEYALAHFRFLVNRDPGWKKKGILDEDIDEFDYEPSLAERAPLHDLYLAVYLNLARTNFKLKDTATALAACDCALDVDPQSDKALVLRAAIRVGPASAGATEQDLAIKDTQAALDAIKTKLAGGGTANEPRDELERRRRETARLLKRLREEQRLQREKDREWGGVFDRGELYREGDAPLKAELRSEDSSTSSTHDEQGVSEEIYRRLEDAERLVHVYTTQGKHREAEKLRREIDESRRKIQQHQRSPAKIDFRNPTPEMLSDAKTKGLDLTDERVVAMLERLQKEQEEKGAPLDEASVDRAFDAEEGRDQDKVRLEIRDIVRGFTAEEVASTLRDLGELHDPQCPAGRLRAQLESKLVQMALRGESMPEGHADGERKRTEAREAESKQRQARLFRTTFIVALVAFLFRLCTSGLLGALWAGQPGSAHWSVAGENDEEEAGF